MKIMIRLVVAVVLVTILNLLTMDVRSSTEKVAAPQKALLHSGDLVRVIAVYQTKEVRSVLLENLTRTTSLIYELKDGNKVEIGKLYEFGEDKVLSPL